jgi:cellulose synthase/poly-beta-1,6-N-acetylglucosamine synthase-like glycosyltransferase
MFSTEFNPWAAIHFTAVSGLALYGMHRLWLLFNWRRLKKSEPPDELYHSLPHSEQYPFITIQLPLYNERFVAERLLNAAAQIQWPKDRLEIQILDDSTDDTKEIVDERVRFWQRKGVSMHVNRRTNRSGFKAGALAYGLTQASGEFIAVFDADFLPTPDFLLRTVPYFSDKNIGMVQARWGFLNARHSWLTGIQSLLLGQHFSIEHSIRFGRGLFFNFNGTAGIWRREAIESAGGWQSDTVTEDLDLSYRAQLAGWRFIYLDDLAVPSELPVTIGAFRSQQQRWAKGSVQTARKILPDLFARPVSFAIKTEATAHLLANLCWLLGTIVTLTLYPTILSRTDIGPYHLLRMDIPLFMITSLAMLLYFTFYNRMNKQRISFTVFCLLPVFTVGIAPSIALSVIKGVFSRGGDFYRTPKFGVIGKEGLPDPAFLYHRRSIPYLIMNAALFFYTLLPVIFAFQRNTYPAIPFLIIFPLGFALVIFKDIADNRKSLSRSARFPNYS